MRTVTMNPPADVWAKFQAIPNAELYKAIGYLIQWGVEPHNVETESTLSLTFIYKEGDGLEILAAYVLNGTRPYFICAIWNPDSQSFSFHS